MWQGAHACVRVRVTVVKIKRLGWGLWNIAGSNPHPNTMLWKLDEAFYFHCLSSPRYKQKPGNKLGTRWQTQSGRALGCSAALSPGWLLCCQHSMLSHAYIFVVVYMEIKLPATPSLKPWRNQVPTKLHFTKGCQKVTRESRWTIMAGEMRKSLLQTAFNSSLVVIVIKLSHALDKKYLYPFFPKKMSSIIYSVYCFYFCPVFGHVEHLIYSPQSQSNSLRTRHSPTD